MLKVAILGFWHVHATGYATTDDEVLRAVDILRAVLTPGRSHAQTHA